MVSRDLTIVNKLGLHARAAAKFVNLASRFQSEVHLEREGRQVNGKSIMGVMMLAASPGTTITLAIDGEDEGEALDELARLVEDGFGEQD
ncbi:MAG TPA: HPr family phosphocarrier protein [Gammaproteobacteria bacterium]|nr:HPr family phosphocarrier protein [Gammaproteobacteria bacterium]